MPRTRSEHYDDKKRNLLEVAAKMFADTGYVSCRMEDIAERCDVSKSMLYHYFKRKEDILYAILSEYVARLNMFIEEFLEQEVAADRKSYFQNFLTEYLQIAIESREKHAVTLNDTRWLTAEQLKLQEDLERRNVDLFVELLKRVNPGYAVTEYRVYAFLLIGMINWVGLWYKSSGQISPGELYDRIGQLFLDGFMTEYKAR